MRRQGLKLIPQPHLAAVNAQFSTGIVEGARLSNERPQRREFRAVQRKIGAVTQKNPVLGTIERLKNLRERNMPVIHTDSDTQPEPVP